MFRIDLYPYRLSDVVQSDGRLYLVFEFVDKDLKKYFEACEGMLTQQLIKVRIHETFMPELNFTKVSNILF